MTTIGSNATARDRLRERLIELRDDALDGTPIAAEAALS
jgi:hypothetical protein